MSSKNKRKQNRKRRSKGRRGKMATSRVSREVYDLARMISDPCKGPAVKPQYGSSESGYLSRFSKNTLLSLTTHTNGYVLWFPDYTGLDSQDIKDKRTNGNFVLFTCAASTDYPVNTSAAPLFTGTSGGAINGRCREDPAYEFVNSGTCQDARTAAACISLMFNGRMDEVSGEVALLQGIPRDIFFNVDGKAPSPDSLFVLSPKHMRTQLDKMEVLWRPGVASKYFRTSGLPTETGHTSSDTPGHDKCLDLGIPGTSVTKAGAAIGGATGSALGYGFAWRGVASTAGGFRLETTKVLEWRPNIRVGYRMTVPRLTHSADLMAASTSWLDSAHKGWDAGIEGVKRIAKLMALAKQVRAGIVDIQEAYSGATAAWEPLAPLMLPAA